MKKTILLGVIAVAVMSTSCRKERTCECKTSETTERSGFGAKTVTQSTQYKVTVAKQKKKEFRIISDCYSTKDTRTENGGNGNNAYTDFITTETTCDLK